MIEFLGELSDDAIEVSYKYERKFMIKLFCGILLFLFSFVLIICLSTKDWKWLFFYSILFAVLGLFPILPRSKKDKRKGMPNKVFIDGEFIVASIDGHEDYQCLSDVVKVIDYGDFYFFTFPIGKLSRCFICQKNLIDIQS